MPQSLSRHSRAALAGLAMIGSAAGLVACGSPAHPGVSVATLAGEVNFGTIKPAADTTTTNPSSSQPTATSPQVPGAPVVGVGSTTAPPGTPSFNYTGPGALPPLTPIGGNLTGKPMACPYPTVGTSPAKAVTPAAIGTPAEGHYLEQLVTGKFVSGISAPVLSKDTLANETVSNVSKIVTTKNPTPGALPQTRFTYDLEQPQANGDVITFSMDVVNNAIASEQVSADGELSDIDAGVDSGISILSEVETTKAGKQVWSFDPATPITLLPLPVVTGDSFVSTGTDPLTGESLTIQGKVASTDRVTGCGIYVQGWQVKATEVGRAPASNGQIAQIDGTGYYDIATQYGGLVVLSLFSSAGSTAVTGTQIGTITATKKPQKTK